MKSVVLACAMGVYLLTVDIKFKANLVPCPFVVSLNSAIQGEGWPFTVFVSSNSFIMASIASSWS